MKISICWENIEIRIEGGLILIVFPWHFDGGVKKYLLYVPMFHCSCPAEPWSGVENSLDLDEYLLFLLLL